MLTPKLVEKLIDILTKNKIEVFDHYSLEDGSYVILVEHTILVYDEQTHVLSVSFHVSAEPEFVAIFIMSIGSVDVKVEVTECFHYVSEGNFLTGEEARKVFTKTLQDNVVQKFIEEQTQIHALSSSKCYRA